MADISKPILYRGLDVNNVTQLQRVIRGIAVESLDYSNVEAVGYMEKRAASDGMYASDVYLGARLIHLTGHVYGTTLAELFDYLHILRAIFSPTSAYQESPGEKGFIPLYFQEPTLDTESFEDGTKNLFINVRPRALTRFNIGRDRIVSDTQEPRPTAIPWSIDLIAKDPLIYVDPMQVISLAGSAVTVPQSPPLEAINRGDYSSPLNILLNVGTVSTTHTFHLVGFGVDMTISILNESNRVYRYRGVDRTLMVQDASDPTSPEALRMDLLAWGTKERFPSVPADINPVDRPFTSTFTYTCSCALATGSRLFWNEAFA